MLMYGWKEGGKVQSRLNDGEYCPWQSDIVEECLEIEGYVVLRDGTVMESMEIRQLLHWSIWGDLNVVFSRIYLLLYFY